jgi:transglutaminase superfamily protein
MRKGLDSLLEKWRRFCNRPLDERALILRALIFLPITEIGLRVMGFRRFKKMVENLLLRERRSRTSESVTPYEMVAKITRAVRSAELHGPGTPNCLERSMVLWWMLRSGGIEGELHIGARKNGLRFEAHAWVELDGKVLNDSPDVHTHYARFDAPLAAGNADSHSAGKADSQ